MQPSRVLAVCCAAIAVLLSTVAPSAAGSGSMVDEVNAARRAHGLHDLRQVRSLRASSRRFARHLMRVDQFAHPPRLWISRRFSRRGETLALRSGWRLRARQVVRSWLRSPGHRALLLSNRFPWIGASHARGRMRGRRATVWVLHFAAP